ncbi:MAG TPA: hypothetical protein VF529_19260 [Solirubrobacteraceae bacterium]|jgi:hypothetical protein
MTVDEQLQAFVAFSAAITGFTPIDLHGTGQADAYRSTVAETTGGDVLAELLEAWTRVCDEAQGDSSSIQRLLRREIFSDPKLGPVARNIVKLWYVGIWYELPPAWIDAFGALEENYTFTVSASAYTNGMLWTAIGGNPPGARGPGYGSWAGPPRFPGVAEGN